MQPDIMAFSDRVPDAGILLALSLLLLFILGRAILVVWKCCRPPRDSGEISRKQSRSR
jgi:hypothetical protein